MTTPPTPLTSAGTRSAFRPSTNFLERGPLDEQPPAALVEQVRACLVKRGRPRAAIELVAVVADPGRFLARVDAELDGVWITAGRPLAPGGEGVFFAGSIGLGDHRVGAAFVFVTHGAAPDITYSKDEAFTVAAGERLRIVFTVTDKTATAVMTRSARM